MDAAIHRINHIYAFWDPFISTFLSALHICASLEMGTELGGGSSEGRCRSFKPHLGFAGKGSFHSVHSLPQQLCVLAAFCWFCQFSLSLIFDHNNFMCFMCRKVPAKKDDNHLPIHCNAFILLICDDFSSAMISFLWFFVCPHFSTSRLFPGQFLSVLCVFFLWLYNGTIMYLSTYGWCWFGKGHFVKSPRCPTGNDKSRNTM